MSSGYAFLRASNTFHHLMFYRFVFYYDPFSIELIKLHFPVVLASFGINIEQFPLILKDEPKDRMKNYFKEFDFLELDFLS